MHIRDEPEKEKGKGDWEIAVCREGHVVAGNRQTETGQKRVQDGGLAEVGLCELSN